MADSAGEQHTRRKAPSTDFHYLEEVGACQILAVRSDTMSVTSVERAFRILGVVGAEPRTLSEIADAVDMPLSTASRFLGSLQGTGAVRRDTDGTYRIGPTIDALAGRPAADPDLLSLAQPHMAQLARLSGETSGVAAALDTTLLHLGQRTFDDAADVIVRDWTGVEVAMHPGCTGLVMMAWWPEARVDTYLAEPLEAFSPVTVTEPEQIRQRLADIRRTGLLWTTDEYARGVTSVAAAVRDAAGDSVAALHVHGPSYRFPKSNRREIEVALLAGVNRMSTALGFAEQIGA